MEKPESPLGLMRWVGFAQRKAADDWIRERGLTMEQGFTIGWIRDNPGAIQRDIVRAMWTSAASVSSLLGGLEKRGLIERRTEAGDERSKRVYATPEAIELVSGFTQAMEAADDDILSPLDATERQTLKELLLKVVDRLPEPTRG